MKIQIITNKWEDRHLAVQRLGCALVPLLPGSFPWLWAEHSPGVFCPSLPISMEQNWIERGFLGLVRRSDFESLTYEILGKLDSLSFNFHANNVELRELVQKNGELLQGQIEENILQIVKCYTDVRWWYPEHRVLFFSRLSLSNNHLLQGCVTSSPP